MEARRRDDPKVVRVSAVEIVQLLVSAVHRYVGRPADGAVPGTEDELVQRIEVRRNLGIVGDRYFGKPAHRDASITIMAAENLPVGIDPENVLTARLSVPEAGNPDAATLFLTQLEERIARQPGVVSAAVATCHALAGGCSFNGVLFPDRPAAPRGTEPLVGVVRVSPSYFETMKIPVLRGRGFSSGGDLLLGRRP